MLKQTLFFLFFTFCTQVSSEVNLDKKHSYADKPEELNNVLPLLTLHTGNPIHLTKQERNNNFYLYPVLKPNLNGQTIDIHQYDPNSNILKTIIIVPPKSKKPCDRNTSTPQPVQTEKPTTTRTCDKSTEKPTTTTKTTTVSLNAIEVTANPNKITANPNDVTAKPNEASPTAAIDRTTRAPVVGDPDGSTKCIQDGVYRASNVTCDQFYVCIHGIQYLMDCPYGLVFNDYLKICDWLENVSDCKPPAFKDFVCPDEGYGTNDDLILQFRYRDSCSQYVACHKRKPRLLNCDSGYYFHEEYSTCTNFRSSTNCRDVWYSYSTYRDLK